MDYSNNDYSNNNASEKGDYHQRPSSPGEQESVSLPPLNAMAFTIPLDEPKVKWKGKSFSIKDAIRKFAPPKPDTIEKQRPVKAKSIDTEKSNSKTKDKSKKDDNGKLPKEPEGHVSDSASYLIQRMLNDESQQLQCDDLDDENNEIPNLKRSDSKRKVRDSDNSGKKSSSINGCVGEKDSGVCDDKSESGTYTLDKNDPVVEEARKRIDQVFGVPSDSEQLLASPANLEQVKSSLASITALKNVLSSSKTEDNMYSSSATINRSLQDRRPSDTKPPLISSTYLNSRTHTRSPSSNPGSDSESNCYSIFNTQRKQSNLSGDNDTNSKDQWTRKNSMDRSSVRSRTHSFTKRSSKSPSSSPSPASRAISSSTTASPSKTYTPASPSNQRRDKVRSRSAHRNVSDFDLGDYDDSNSIKSEASNASTERSSGSGKGKSGDTNDTTVSSMRFNRAFALRRAKLGMDTLGVPLNLTAERQAHHSSILESRSNPRSTPSPTFNRSDGGRFSLRLSNNNKSSNRKPPVANPNHWSRQSTLVQHGTGNTSRQQPVINKLRNASTCSDTENRCSSPSRSVRSIPIQKSSSFHNPKDSNSIASARRDISSSSSYRGMSPFSISKRFISNNNPMSYTSNRGSSSNLNLSNYNSISSSSPQSLPPLNHNYGDRRGSMSESLNDAKLSRLTGSTTRSIPAPTHATPTSTLIKPSPSPTSTPTRTLYNGESGKSPSSGKELSALDKLVISAIFQLSHKLRHNLRVILDNERLKYPPGSETRLMIEDLIPQVAVQEKRILDNGEISRDLSSILKNLKKVEQSYELVTLLLANGSTNSLRNSSLPGADNDFYGGSSISCTDFQDEY